CARLSAHVRRTRLASSRLLDERVGARVVLKCENEQRTGSFKIRGALNRMLQLSGQDRARGVVAASSGNHAQG
ncbi:MAG: threonine ammonia-lyase, partial [Chloroflexota bacterium]